MGSASARALRLSPKPTPQPQPLRVYVRKGRPRCAARATRFCGRALEWFRKASVRVPQCNEPASGRSWRLTLANVLHSQTRAEPLLQLGSCECKDNFSEGARNMRRMVISVGAGVVLLASYGWAVAQGHMHGFGGGGGMHGPGGGGGFHAPGGGFRSGPSMMPHGSFQAPRAYRAERAPRMEHSYRAEHTGRAQSRSIEHLQRAYSQRTRRAEYLRMDRSHRAQRELRQGSDTRSAERLRSNERTVQ